MKILIRNLLAGIVLAASLTGCAAELNPLQPTSTIVLEGETPTKLAAPDNGQITVYDVGDDRILWNGAIKKGQTFVVDPVNHQVTVDGMTCTPYEIRGGHTLRVTFSKTV